MKITVIHKPDFDGKQYTVFEGPFVTHHVTSLGALEVASRTGDKYPESASFAPGYWTWVHRTGIAEHPPFEASHRKQATP